MEASLLLLAAKDWWDYASVLANCGLVLFALVGSILAYMTVKSTKKAADAALLNAQAVIDSERAWILVTISREALLPEKINPTLLMAYFLSPTVVNRGKSVCKLTWMFVTKRIIKSTSQLPSDPDYSEIPESSVLRDELVLAPESPLTPLSIGISMSEIQRVREGNEALYVYGYVVYEIGAPTSERKKATRFCFVYNIPGGYSPLPEGFLMAAGLPNYTSAT
jgi:hypothetical protein